MQDLNVKREVNQKFTFHVLGLPHTQTTKQYDSCAFTAKGRKFCDMMKSLGHKVFNYSSEEDDSKADELITCITKKEQQELIGVYGPEDIHKSEFNWNLPHWQIFNQRAAEGIQKRIGPTDFILIMAGLCHKPVCDIFPNNFSVEYGIGYSGSYARFRVFETIAWQHCAIGREQALHNACGHNYDRVIPSYFEEELFPYSEEKDDYYLFIGRITRLKGFEIPIQVCQTIGAKLVVAGIGDAVGQLPSWVDYRGLVGVEERGRLMSRAKAQFVPTLYVEPFGSVVAESMICGTPVVTTDFGAFPELVRPGIDGFRCHTFNDFVNAAIEAPKLPGKPIREYAIERFSMNNVRWMYQKYFEDLYDLKCHGGWYYRK